MAGAVWERLFNTTLPEHAAHLAPLVECGTTALHLILIGGKAPPRVLATDPKLRIALVHDALQTGASRTLAYAFGCLLGLRRWWARMACGADRGRSPPDPGR